MWLQTFYQMEMSGLRFCFFGFFLVYILIIKMCHHTLHVSNDTTDIAEKEFERIVCITAVAEVVLCAMHVQKPGEERSVQQQHPPG